MTNPFQEIKKFYGSSANMLEALKDIDGFREVDRSTLFRWQKLPKEKLPSRALIALKSLEPGKQKDQLKLRIGEPRSLLALPSVLAWLSPKQEESSRLKIKYKVDPIVTTYSTGAQALQKLLKDELDIAIAADILIDQNLGENCQKLCNLSSCPFIAITCHSDIQFLSDFKNLSIGYPEPSVIPQVLKSITQEKNIKFGKLYPYATPEAAREALESRKIDAIVGWDWWIYSIVNKIRKTPIVKLPNIFGTHHVHVAVNTKTANPKAIFRYLACIKEISDNLHLHLRHTSRLEKHLEVNSGQLHQNLKSFTYDVQSIPIRTMCDLLKSTDYFNG